MSGGRPCPANGAGPRDKGLRGQREVRRLFEAHGWTVTATSASKRRGRAGTGDLLAMRDGITLAVEVKNQATLRLPAWKRQTEANAPAGTVPVLAYKFEHIWQVAYMLGYTWYDTLAVQFAIEYGRTVVAA